MEIIKEIKELANLVEVEKNLKAKNKAEKRLLEMIRENKKPYYTAYYSNYFGDDIHSLEIIIYDEKGNEYKCPQSVSENFACSHTKPHYESGVGIACFLAQLIRSGIAPKEFKIVEKIREEINRERVYRDYRVQVGNITIEHLNAVKQYLLETLTK